MANKAKEEKYLIELTATVTGFKKSELIKQVARYESKINTTIACFFEGKKNQRNRHLIDMGKIRRPSTAEKLVATIYKTAYDKNPRAYDEYIMSRLVKIETFLVESQEDLPRLEKDVNYNFYLPRGFELKEYEANRTNPR